jgi:hypothetical protein
MNSAKTGLISNNGEPVERVQAFDLHCQSLNRQELADCCGNSLRPGLSSLSKDSDPGPVRIFPRAPAYLNDISLVDTMQVKQHLDMRELRKFFEGKGREFALVQVKSPRPS